MEKEQLEFNRTQLLKKLNQLKVLAIIGLILSLVGVIRFILSLAGLLG